MTNLVTPQQVWDAWSADLIPYFRKCEKSLTDIVIQDVIVKYASNRSISFQKQLMEYMRSQVDSIIYKSEPLDTVTLNCQDIKTLITTESIKAGCGERVPFRHIHDQLISGVNT